MNLWNNSTKQESGNMENAQTQAAEVQTAEQGTKTVQKPDVPKMTLFQKLLAIQTQMKAPKNSTTGMQRAFWKH